MNKICRSLNLLAALLLVISIVQGCSNPSESAYDDSFMPLKIGNRWSFAPIHGNTPPDPWNVSEVWEVIGTKVVSNKTFYTIRRYYTIPPMNNEDTLYLNLSDNKLYEYLRRKDSQWIITTRADFSLEESESFSYNGDFNLIGRVESKEEDMIKFFMDSPESIDEEYYVVFKRGLGFYERFSPGWNSGIRLVAAELK